MAEQEFVGEIPDMTIEQAEIHMHNFAHSFLSPLVLLGAWRRMKTELAHRDALTTEVERLEAQQATLQEEIRRRQTMRDELSATVELLSKRQHELSTLIAQDAAGMISRSEG